MLLLLNKTAKRDYEILKTYLAGIALEGHEVKSLRQKAGSLKEAYVKIIGNQAFLINAQINAYKFASYDQFDPKRTRKLLLKKSEIIELAEAAGQKNRTIVPLSIETRGPHLKLQLGLGRGKKEYEKRADLKKKAQDRDVAYDLKNLSRR